MKQNMRNSDSGVKTLLGRLAAEKKKTVIALCLIGVMVLMWARMLSGEAPEGAGAAPMAQNAIAGQLDSEIKVTFTGLPKVKGRNDVLTRDFFAANGWVDFARDGKGLTGAEEVNVSEDGNEELVRRIAGKLKVKAVAIGSGDNPQVCINDKPLSVGGKLTIKEGVNAYECEVVGIKENKVSIRFGEAEITLKLVHSRVTD